MQLYPFKYRDFNDYLLSKDRFISLSEILSTVDKVTNFSNCFEHWQLKHNRARPDKKVLYAGIIAYGCNLGVRTISKSCTSISQNTLENITNWYFGSKGINKANNKPLDTIGQLNLSRLFQKDLNIMHTSSDGQKFNMGVDSLNANHSFKYFGKGKGVSVSFFGCNGKF